VSTGLCLFLLWSLFAGGCGWGLRWWWEMVEPCDEHPAEDKGPLRARVYYCRAGEHEIRRPA
jgi:hypothetical protein